MKLLLLSNSGQPLYEWCKEYLADFIDGEPVTFISAATVYDPQEYFEQAATALKDIKANLIHLTLENIDMDLLDHTKLFLVGGGNTYHLLQLLKEANLLSKIRDKVLGGTKYIGFSAGANIAGSTILTTNDWNVTGSNYFDGLGVVPFNINPHYIDPHDKSVFSGESRDDRISEYFVFRKEPVLAMEEKTLLKMDGAKMEVLGQGRVKLFLKDEEPMIYKSRDLLEV